VLYQSLSLIGIITLLITTAAVITIVVPSNNIASANGMSQPYLSVVSYDCSIGSDGCEGNVYCDINDEGSCYDRYEGNDDGSSTNPQSASYRGNIVPQDPLFS